MKTQLKEPKPNKEEATTDRRKEDYIEKALNTVRLVFGGTAASQTMAVIFLLILIVYDPSDALLSNVLRSVFIILLGLWQNIQTKQFECECRTTAEQNLEAAKEISEIQSKGRSLLGIFKILDVPEFLSPLLPSKELFEDTICETAERQFHMPNKLGVVVKLVFGGAASLQSMTVLFLLVLLLYDPIDPVWSNVLRLAFIVILGAWQNISEEDRRKVLAAIVEKHEENKMLLKEIKAKFAAMIQIIQNLQIPEDLKPFVSDLFK